MGRGEIDTQRYAEAAGVHRAKDGFQIIFYLLFDINLQSVWHFRQERPGVFRDPG